MLQFRGFLSDRQNTTSCAAGALSAFGASAVAEAENLAGVQAARAADVDTFAMLARVSSGARYQRLVVSDERPDATLAG